MLLAKRLSGELSKQFADWHNGCSPNLEFRWNKMCCLFLGLYLLLDSYSLFHHSWVSAAAAAVASSSFIPKSLKVTIFLFVFFFSGRCETKNGTHTTHAQLCWNKRKRCEQPIIFNDTFFFSTSLDWVWLLRLLLLSQFAFAAAASFRMALWWTASTDRISTSAVRRWFLGLSKKKRVTIDDVN